MLSNIRSLGLGLLAASSVALLRPAYAELYLQRTPDYAYFNYYLAVAAFGVFVFALAFLPELGLELFKNRTDTE